MMNLIPKISCNGNGNNNGSNANDFVVTITKSTEAGRFVADKTRAEIATAFAAGKRIAFLLTLNNTAYQIDDIAVKTIDDEPWIILRERGAAPHPNLWIVYGPTTDDGDMLYVTSERIDWGGFKDLSVSTLTVPGAVTERFYNWECGELDSLTVTTFPEDGVWRISFTSGSTPTVLALPQGLLGLDGFTPAANTEYVLELAFGIGYVGIPVVEEEEEEEEEGEE